MYIIIKQITNRFILCGFIIIGCLSSSFANDTIKVLAIGNSFSRDAVEAHLDDLAVADGVMMVIGNMHVPGCSLERHWRNASQNIAEYRFQKMVNGDSTITENVSLLTAITDENWDFISFQQVSGNSGLYDTYFPYLSYLKAYAESHVTNPEVQFAIHQTWAYPSYSTHSAFPRYNSNQLEMYQAIVTTVKSVAEEVGISVIIPSGTAVQNARSSFIGDNFNRDGSHLSFGLGRYVAACTWYEKLTGRSAIGNSFKPEGVSAIESNIAQHAAHYAVLDPFQVTSMADFSMGEIRPLSAGINIDIGPPDYLAPYPWNNLTNLNEGTAIYGMTDVEGDESSVSIYVHDGFGFTSKAGPTSTSAKLELHPDASRDAFYGNALGEYNGVSDKTAGFTVMGLHEDQAFDFYFFSSRNAMTDNRETKFSLKGLHEKETAINSSQNTTELAIVNHVVPDEKGQVSIDITAGENNNNRYKFFYLNAMKIIPATETALLDKYHKKMNVYPNPVKSIATVRSHCDLDKIEVFDLAGMCVYMLQNINSNHISINFENLSQGYYLVKSGKKQVSVLKL